MNIFPSHQNISITSREIAALVGSRHSNVRISIERLAEKGVIRLPAMQTSEIINNLGLPQPVSEFVFIGEQGKRDSIVVVAQLSPEFTARLVDRWQELEAQAQTPSIPQTLPEALRLAADLAEENHRLAHERDEAVRAKTHISAGREATIMGRLGNLVKENDRLKRDLGYNRDYKATRAIAWLGEYFDVSQAALLSQVGKTLTAIGKEIGLPPRDIEDSQYGTIKAHHLDAIDLFRVRLDKDERLLAKYRKEEVAA